VKFHTIGELNYYKFWAGGKSMKYFTFSRGSKSNLLNNMPLLTDSELGPTLTGFQVVFPPPCLNQKVEPKNGAGRKRSACPSAPSHAQQSCGCVSFIFSSAPLLFSRSLHIPQRAAGVDALSRPPVPRSNSFDHYSSITNIPLLSRIFDYSSCVPMYLCVES
jgi:hypothetical protein